MKLNEWYKKRGIQFVFQRAKRLGQRYGAGAGKAMARINDTVDELDQFDCHPTFFVPAVVARRNLDYIRGLQSRGCEIGVHGYQHVDLKSYPAAESSAQLMRAVESFKELGLEVHGFRCPYLSSSDELLRKLPAKVFKYSSNKAIGWTHQHRGTQQPAIMFEKIEEFYQPMPADSTLCLPWMQDGMVEVPVCVPDDLQMYDGLSYSVEEMSSAWVDILRITQQKGDLFNLIFHPELAALCNAPFIDVLKEARTKPNSVWVAPLRDIGDWWLEKEAFRVEIERQHGGFLLNLLHTPRGTVLYRGFEVRQPSLDWDGHYRRLLSDRLEISGPTLPLIKLESGLPDWAAPALRGMGYITLAESEAYSGSLTIGRKCVEEFSNPVLLREHIESSEVPLVRFWPWPDGQRSALCLTGDLDALSLADYATRLFVN